MARLNIIRITWRSQHASWAARSGSCHNCTNHRRALQMVHDGVVVTGSLGLSLEGIERCFTNVNSHIEDNFVLEHGL